MRTKSRSNGLRAGFGKDVDGRERDIGPDMRTFAEIGKEMGCSQQAASIFYDRTIRKVARLFYREIFEAQLHNIKMFSDR